MPSELQPPTPHPAPLDALEAALAQSHDVKAKVEAVVDDLGMANDVAKDRLARGTTTLPAAQVLQTGLAVELTVQECADDLQQVTRNLVQGMDKVKAVGQALVRSREALAESQQALAASRDAERAASHLAMHDQKTGLPNRTLFDDRLAQAIAGAERHGWMLTVMFLDLDRFKSVNDTHGHAAGDAVLRTVAQRLLRHARDEDTICRNGGDEFLYLLINPRSRDDVARIAAQVCAAIAAPIGVGALQLVAAASVGIALYPDHGSSPDALIAHADTAMYAAKQVGSPTAFYVPAGPAVPDVPDVPAAEPGAAPA